VASPINGGNGGVDLLVLDPSSGRTTALQVKTVNDRHNSVIVTVGRQSRLGELPLLYNLLVVKKDDEGYRFYIVPRGEMRILMREAWRRFVEKGEHRRPPNPDSVRPLIIYIGQLTPHEDRWDDILANGRQPRQPEPPRT
jgi:hypothetical protein